MGEKDRVWERKIERCDVGEKGESEGYIMYCLKTGKEKVWEKKRKMG